MKHSSLYLCALLSAVLPILNTTGQDAAPAASQPAPQAQAEQLESVKASSFGYNAEDATDCLQKAFDSGAKEVIIDNVGTPWIIRPVFLRSNQHVLLQKGVQVIAKEDEFKDRKACLFTVDHEKDIVLEGEEGSSISMRKKDYQDHKRYAGSQWRHAVSLVSAHNIVIRNLAILSSGGDGIYIGQGRYKKGWEPQASHNILVDNCRIDNHHRQGVSVIVCSKLTLRNCTISGTCGTEPEAGIDFENSDKSQYFQEILVENCRFLNNHWCGVNFSCLCQKPMDVTIRDCYFEGNLVHPLVFSGRPKVPNTGLVTVENCTFAKNNAEAINFSNFNEATSYKILIKDCKIEGTPYTTQHPVTPVTFRVSDTRYRQVGNVQFENLQVTGFGKSTVVKLYSRLGGASIVNVTGDATMGGKKIDLAQQIASDKTASIPEYKAPAFRNFQKGTGEKRLANSLQSRKPMEAVIYAKKGEVMRFTIHHLYLYKNPPSAIRKPGFLWKYEMATPSGKKVALEPFGVIPDSPENQKEYTITAEEEGLYVIDLNTPTDSVMTEFVPYDANLCWGVRSAPSMEGLMMFRVQPGVTSYTAYNGVFDVPEGTDRFTFECRGARSVTLRDATGKVAVAAKEEMGSYEFIAPYPGVWKFELERMMSNIEIRLSSDIPGILSVAPGNLPQAKQYQK